MSSVSKRGVSPSDSATYCKMFLDMETQIHILEQEAYSAVLRAFKAQADAITWDKEALITELRKELRVSDDEHRELLTRVNGDEIIQKIRDWRQGGAHQVARFGGSQLVQDVVPSPTVSGSRKKLKTSGGQPFPGLSSVKPKQYPPAVTPANRHFASFGSSASVLVNERGEATTSDPLIGQKVWTRWPEDNNFYEAVITDYNPTEGRHALVYDINTASEAWEWVDLKELSPEDIRWEVVDLGTYHRGLYGGPGRGIRNTVSQGGFVPSAGRGRGSTRGMPRRDFPPGQNQNGYMRRIADDIELPSTEGLVEEVERILGASYHDPFELDKAKKMLKEHEQALVDAIARLADTSDGESDGELQILHGQPVFHG